MTSFRSRPTIAICLMTGTVVSISLAGLVWAQAPAENWPFDEHNQPSTAQPASPPKSAVQKRLEELYQRDHRPLPDYMQQDGGGEQAAPANSATPAGQGAPLAVDPRAQRIQRDSAAAQGTSQGNVRQQLSDYYQSQGKAIPTPTRTVAGPQYSSSQAAPGQARQASAAQPAQQHWYDRINPFHKSTSAAPPQTQVQNSAPLNTAANDANHSSPTSPMPSPPTQPAPVATAQAQLNSGPAPAAKSGSFWGDLSLRRVPQQAANDPRLHTEISIELGPSGHLVPKAKPSEPMGRATLAPEQPVVAHVVAPEPAVVTIPAEPQPTSPAAQKVSAANAVAEEPAMPFRETTDADADHPSESGPYTGLTLEDEQSQLVAPKSEDTKSAPHRAAAPAPAKAADAHHAEESKTVSAAPQSHETHQQKAPEAAAPAAQQQHAAATGHVHYSQTTADKVRLIGERVGQRGLKGFCPVVLRDQRELADVNPAYCSVYRGQKYCFSSAEAQAAFESAPHKYAPVAAGVDIVVKTNSDQAVEGSLDFALWYKDRLYLFCSPESLQAFSVNPTAYAAAAQRIQ
jgi:YHS domain-containing protein